MKGLRYLFVSAICFATHVAIMILADRAGMPLSAAILLSFGIVVLVGYALHARLTFAVASNGRAFVAYAIAMAAILPLSAALLWLFGRLLAIPMPLAAPIAALLTLAVNFILARWSLTGRARTLRSLP